MAISIKVTDKREQKDMPAIDPAQFNVQAVLDHADIVTGEDEDLTIEVILRNGAQAENGMRTPTSVLEHGHKEELFELELEDAVSNEAVKVWQKRQVLDENAWTIHVMILPKEELGFASLRALSRAISREVFAISAIRSYGEMMAAIYPTVKDFEDARTKFADEAPWAVA